MKKSGYKINKPKIYSWNDYLEFYSLWKKGIARLNTEIRRGKTLRGERQRNGLSASLIQKKLAHRQLMARKMYQLLVEARTEAYERRKSEAELKKLLTSYPIEFPRCKEVVFHFNKGWLFNKTIPMWVVRARGETFYVYHVDTDGVKWSTKEAPDHPSTQGSIKFKNVSLYIDESATATIGGLE